MGFGWPWCEDNDKDGRAGFGWPWHEDEDDAAANRDGGAAMSLPPFYIPNLQEILGNSMRLNVVLVHFANSTKNMNWVWVAHVPLKHLEDVFLFFKDLAFCGD